jgi:hypothetical protein
MMPRVSVSPKILQAELARYLAQVPAVTQAEHEGAKQHSVLPLFNDFVGCWALDMAGRLVFFAWEEPGKLELVSEAPVDSAAAHVALAAGSIRFPALASIGPMRPKNARACTSCDGTGRVAGAPDNIICACGGVGWLPPAAE